MPTTQSKEAGKDEKRKKTQLRLLNIHMLSNIALSLFTFSSRTTLLQQLVKNDSARMVNILSTWASTIGAAEFLLNPTMGRLSDYYGRKPFMLMSPVACVILKTWCALNPSILALSLEKVICDGLRTMSGSTMCKAALSDLCTDTKELGNAIATLYSWAGVAIIGGPLVSSMLTNPRVTFGISAIWAVGQLIAEWFYLQETHPVDKRDKEFKGFANPFGMFKLFTISPTLSKLSSMQMLMYLCEPKNMSDISSMFQMESLKWTPSKRDIFVSVVGLSFLSGSKVTRMSMKKYGMYGHTSVMHGLSIIQYLFRAAPYELTTWIGVLIMMVSETRDKAVAALATEEAIKNGLGKGEYSGLAANLRALMVFASPFLWSGLYNRGMKTGNGGLPFLGAAIAMVASELILRTIKKKSD